MPTPRVAAIHDMSGFGRCSLTVAIPVLSAMGVQCCPLPTAYLSTHTGGFTGYTFLDMTDELPKTAAHWAELGIHFDAVYTGFMGSEAQMDLAADFVRTFRRDRSTIFICDPVMGDHGKIYKTYTPAMCAGMTRLVELADVIVPNLTEAAVLLGDRLYTDIACGVNASIDTVLVLSGETKEEDLPDARPQPSFVLPDVVALLRILEA